MGRIETKNTTTRVKDVMEEVRAHDVKFQALCGAKQPAGAGGGKNDAAAVNDLDAAVIEELRRRWTDLQNR